MTKCIITTINPPSEATKSLANRLRVIVIGDKKTPPYQLKGAEFYPWDYPWDFKLAKLLPFNNYARKNLGYLEAMKDNDCIYETDDDTFLKYDWKPKLKVCKAYYTQGDLFLNVYKFFSQEDIWPRGLPFKYIDGEVRLINNIEAAAPLQQGLVDNEPDVDAVWRMRYKKEIFFKVGPSVSLDSWCPTNSQNTWWFKEAFPLMYLPSTCTFRATDIWRGLIAQKCLWAMKYNVVFHQADTYQERNKHNLAKDFEQEIPVYLNAERVVNILGDLNLTGDTYENLRICYKSLIKIGIFEEKEIDLLNAWIEDYENIL